MNCGILLGQQIFIIAGASGWEFDLIEFGKFLICSGQ